MARRPAWSFGSDAVRLNDAKPCMVTGCSFRVVYGNCVVYGNLVVRCANAGILVHARRSNLTANIFFDSVARPFAIEHITHSPGQDHDLG